MKLWIERGDEPRSLKDAMANLTHPRSICMLFLGFSAGLPLLLVFGTLSVWLREAGIERATITFLSWAALGYSFKFVWAPIIDRLPVPVLTRLLGRRRAWLLVSQMAVIASLFWTASFDPASELLMMTVVGAICIGFSSATQDIVIDAYRIESAPPEMQSMLSATYIAGYRVGMVVAGGGALWLADLLGGDNYSYAAWAWVYRAMAGLMLIGIATTLLNPEPETKDFKQDIFKNTADYIRFFLVFVLAISAFAGGFLISADFATATKAYMTNSWGLNATSAGIVVESGRMVFSISLGALTARLMIAVRLVEMDHVRETYLSPVTDFFDRYGRAALVILLLVGTYRISDIVLGVIANVFYLDIGFTKTQIAAYSKFWGLIASIAGGILGGVLALRFGVLRTLLLGALLAPASNLLFLLLAGNPVEFMLLVVVVADNLAGGMASAAFVAYLSSLTSINFTAMQYAIFTSIMLLIPKFVAGYSGTVVDNLGYQWFFFCTALIGVPVVAIIFWLNRLNQSESSSSTQQSVQS